MPAPHILIAGAGIGGLAAAIALARRGIAVTLAEKRTGFGETGAGLQLSPNAGHVLQGLDLTLPLKRASVVAQGLVVRRWRDGAELGGMPMAVGDGETPFRLIRRADLHTILLDAARSLPNIRLLVGRGVQSLTETNEGVVATLVTASGQSESVEALAVIGADGLWSRIRELGGDATPPAFTCYEAWRAIAPRSPQGPAQVTLHLGSGRHAVHYPAAAGRETNLVIVRAAREAREGWSRDGDAALLASHLSGADSALRALATSAGPWQVWSLFDRPVAAMARSRTALLGDAAHPVLPFLAQGAALAIEDAGVLARILTRHLESAGPASVPDALADYARARTQRAARVQQASRANARAYHLAAPWSLGRNLVMKRLGPEGMRSRYDWLYDWRDGD